jgi:hypothetical protein
MAKTLALNNCTTPVCQGPIASIFWRNEEFNRGKGKDIVLDGVVCVVDAVFGKQVRDFARAYELHSYRLSDSKSRRTVLKKTLAKA